MEILTTSRKSIATAAAIVKDGGIIAFPTDTVYGLGCDPRNSQALDRLRSVKGKRRKPFPILVSSLRAAEQIVVMDARARALASEFWPGPFTMVAKSRARLPHLLTMRRKTIAVRCPGNRKTLELIRKCGGLLIGTSANLTGRPACTNAQAVRRCLDGMIDAVVDGGRSRLRTGSTIVRTYPRVAMVRKGPVGEAQINQVLRQRPKEKS